MAKGKKKTLPVEPRTNTVEREAKENKQTKMTCQEQSTLHSYMSPAQPLSPHGNRPFSTIHEGNSSALKVTDASKHTEVKHTVELISKQEHNVAQTLSSLPKVKTVAPQKDDGSCSAAPPNKSQHGTQVKISKQTQKKADSKNSQHSRKVTDYYPIRRSSRKSKAELKCEEQRQIDYLITNNVEDGLKVKYTEGKGRGVFAERKFCKGQFVVEYHGDLLQIADAKKREAQYAQDPTKGCYMYYFQYLNINYCVDATNETDRLGRLINHSKNGNCQTRLHDLNGIPHLILVASRDIEAEEEFLYDYGDRSKEAIAAHPWLKH